jgi:5-methylcytosine-specific restriction endonuclease McrA
MDYLLVLAFFAPLILLIWVLVRHASRIRRDALDKDLRTQHLDNLNPALVRFVLERDQHTCQRCGTTDHVGVDFIGETPSEHEEITASDLEASCVNCFFEQWRTLQDPPPREEERAGILPRFW